MEDVTSWTLDEYIRVIGGETNIEQMWQIVGNFGLQKPTY
jgi:hypothetical protein